MKLVLVSPPLGKYGNNIKGLPLAPPVLEYLAGLTGQVRPDIKIELVDANLDDFDPDTMEADLVGITVLTPQAPWAYRTGDRLKKRGIPVVLGGLHVTALPGEAAPHADALVLGEAESVWAGLLTDTGKRQLKPVYQGEQLSLEKLPRPTTDLLSHQYRFGSFFTARGCPHACNYCAVPEFFGSKIRLRPIPEVVGEVAANRRNFLFNVDDNVWGYNVPHTIELFRELAQNVKGKHWFGACNLDTLDHPRSGEMLDWARQAGLAFVKVGWQSNYGRDRVKAIKRIQDAGIDVMLFIMLGGRQDTKEDFAKIIKLSDELQVSVHPVMLTPLPNTGLYEEYEPFIIPGYDWDKFDGTRAVFSHPAMSPAEREAALSDLWVEIFRLPKIIRRLTKISLKGFPAAHITSFMVQYKQSRAFQQYARIKPV